MEPGRLRFEVTKSKISWGTYFRDQMRPKVGGGFEDYSGRGPSVVAEKQRERNASSPSPRNCRKPGKRRSSWRTTSRRSALQRCERYDVPPSFVSG
jgi:hypothetical protein